MNKSLPTRSFTLLLIGVVIASSAAATAEPRPGATDPVSAGTFIMGDDAHPGSLPQSEQTTAAYEIDHTEVTVKAYAACVDAGVCTAPRVDGRESNNWGRADRLSHPVNSVTWFQAHEFCAWAGKRLPTEAEWEKAARGVKGARFPWGDARARCKLAVMTRGSGNRVSRWGCGKQHTRSVGSRPDGASPFGPVDMIGNVSEWTQDDSSNPAQPGHKIVKGGSFINNRQSLHGAQRIDVAPDSAFPFLGFRCARDP